jgi:hypothetical protein
MGKGYGLTLNRILERESGLLLFTSLRNQIMRNLEHWADSRKTDESVAIAIHAIATTNRTAESIWDDPTPEETAAVIATLVPGETYHWGDCTIRAAA